MAKPKDEGLAPGPNIGTWARVGETTAEELKVEYDIGSKAARELHELAERAGWAGREGEFFKMLALSVIAFWRENV